MSSLSGILGPGCACVCVGGGRFGGERGKQGKNLIFRSASGPWAHTPQASRPPWNCLLATIKVGLDLTRLFPFQADQRASAFLEHPSTTATSFSSSRTCWAGPLPKDVVLRGHKTLLLATAFWAVLGSLWAT